MNKNLLAATKALKRQGPKEIYTVTVNVKREWRVNAVDEEHAKEIATKEWKEGLMSMDHGQDPIITNVKLN